MGGAASMANITHELLEESTHSDVPAVNAGPLAQEVISARRTFSSGRPSRTISREAQRRGNDNSQSSVAGALFITSNGDEVPSHVRRLLQKIGISSNNSINNSNNNNISSSESAATLLLSSGSAAAVDSYSAPVDDTVTKQLVAHIFECLGALEHVVQSSQRSITKDIASQQHPQEKGKRKDTGDASTSGGVVSYHTNCNSSRNNTGKAVQKSNNVSSSTGGRERNDDDSCGGGSGNDRLGLVLHEMVGLYCLSGETLRLVLKSNPGSARAVDSFGRLPLHVAVDRDEPWVQVISNLIAAYPEALQTRDSSSRLPLHIAVDRPEPVIDVVRLLVKLYPKAVMSRRGVGRLPIHYAVFFEQPSTEILACLLAANPKTSRIEDVYGRLPLHYAVDKNTSNVDIIRLLLKAYRKGAAARDSQGRLPLNIALDRDGSQINVLVVRELCQAYVGALEEPSPTTGKTPLRTVVEDNDTSESCVYWLTKYCPRTMLQPTIAASEKSGGGSSNNNHYHHHHVSVSVVQARAAEAHMNPLELCQHRESHRLVRAMLLACPNHDPSQLCELNWAARKMVFLLCKSSKRFPLSHTGGQLAIQLRRPSVQERLAKLSAENVITESVRRYSIDNLSPVDNKRELGLSIGAPGTTPEKHGDAATHLSKSPNSPPRGGSGSSNSSNGNGDGNGNGATGNNSRSGSRKSSRDYKNGLHIIPSPSPGGGGGGHSPIPGGGKSPSLALYLKTLGGSGDDCDINRNNNNNNNNSNLSPGGPGDSGRYSARTLDRHEKLLSVSHMSPIMLYTPNADGSRTPNNHNNSFRSATGSGGGGGATNAITPVRNRSFHKGNIRQDHKGNDTDSSDDDNDEHYTGTGGGGGGSGSGSRANYQMRKVSSERSKNMFLFLYEEHIELFKNIVLYI